MFDIVDKPYKILFQGDSITFANRIKFLRGSLGNGYCNIIGDYLEENYKGQVNCINKGIYGDTTTKLKKRWQKDSLEGTVDVLSLLIGINDTWRRYDRGIFTSEKKFEENYRYFLNSIKRKNPQIKIILMSPFLIPINEKQNKWYEDLNSKIKIVEKLAEEFKAIYIPLNDIFKSILDMGIDKKELTRDGVHPTLKGHEIIAKQWIKAINV
ncbi:MAG: SGNH/GDSL hydrolase family protein [Sarcina sp.]